MKELLGQIIKAIRAEWPQLTEIANNVKDEEFGYPVFEASLNNPTPFLILVYNTFDDAIRIMVRKLDNEDSLTYYISKMQKNESVQIPPNIFIDIQISTDPKTRNIQLKELISGKHYQNGEFPTMTGEAILARVKDAVNRLQKLPTPPAEPA